MNRLPRAFGRADTLWIALAALPALAAGIAVSPYIAAGPFVQDGRLVGLAGKLCVWDAGWYVNIATTGYRWTPDGALWSHNENIAYFPLWPLIERALFWLAPTQGGQLTIGILAGLAFGILSNVAFLGFARTLLPEPAARRAALLFTLWPAACFLAMGYPTGLINLLAILCLRNRLSGHSWRAVLWSGAATALSPTSVFIAAAIGLDLAWSWWRDGAPPAALPRLAAQGLIAIAGLAAFMLFQAVTFGDPIAFIEAQGGFDPASPPIDHLIRLFNPVWYILPADFAWHVLLQAAWQHLTDTAHGRQILNIGWQWTLDLLALAFTLTALLCPAGRRLPGVVRLSGWCVLFGFLWFTATSPINVTNGMRMLFPEFPVFLLLGARLHGASVLSLALAFGAVTAFELALVLDGYGVI